MNIRMVEKKDFKDWLHLRKSLWPENSLAELEEEMQQTYTEIKKSPIFLAEDKERKICGFIEVSIHSKVPGCTTKKVGYIEGWYVKPEYRKMGIGKELLSEAEKWAQSQGCKEMASDTNEKFPISLVAHKSLGYKNVFTDFHFRKTFA